VSRQASGAARREPAGKTGLAVPAAGLRAAVETGWARPAALLRRGAAEVPAATAKSPVLRRELPGERAGAMAAEQRLLMQPWVVQAAVLGRPAWEPESPAPQRARGAAAARAKAPIPPARPAERVARRERPRPLQEPRADVVPRSLGGREAERMAVAAEVAPALRLPDAVRPEAEGEVAPAALPEDGEARACQAPMADPPPAGDPTRRAAVVPGLVQRLAAGRRGPRRADLLPDPVEGGGSGQARLAGLLACQRALRRQAALPEPPPGAAQAGQPEASRRPLRALKARTQRRRTTAVFPVRAAARARPLSHRTG